MSRPPATEEPPLVRSRVRKEEDVVFRDLAGEAVILNLKTGLYYGLDEVGTRAWAVLMDRGDVEEVVTTLLSEYDVDEGKLRADVDELVANLHSNKLVRFVDE